MTERYKYDKTLKNGPIVDTETDEDINMRTAVKILNKYYDENEGFKISMAYAEATIQLLTGIIQSALTDKLQDIETIQTLQGLVDDMYDATEKIEKLFEEE